MINVDFKGLENQLADLKAAYTELPRHLAKKHLQASVKRTIADGIPVMKAITPKGATRRVGKGGESSTRVRGGALRRAVTTKAKYVGRGSDGSVYGVVGYRASFESRKAIWLEFGTSRGITPRNLIDQFMQQYGGPSAEKLVAEMANGLEKAASELAAGMNKGGGR